MKKYSSYISSKIAFLGCLYALSIRLIDLSYTYSNASVLFNVLPGFFVKIWGIFILQGKYIPLLLVIYLFFTLVGYLYNKISIELKLNVLIPTIISILSSGLFIMGLGNYYNKLYTRFLFQFIIGLLIESIYFYLVITRWNIINRYYFNTPLWTIGFLILGYATYVIYDTYLCALAKYNKKNYPKFLGIKMGL